MGPGPHELGMNMPWDQSGQARMGPGAQMGRAHFRNMFAVESYTPQARRPREKVSTSFAKSISHEHEDYIRKSDHNIAFILE